ncbi:MAG: transglutaminase-like domain-containing protein [Limisphaerales bacterium]
MLRPSPIAKLFALLSVSAFTLSSFALSLEDLRRQDLSPTKFANHFRNFKFTFRKEIQHPTVFLATKSGDCDDYSTLAAAVLREKGYTPRLISVRMPGVTHVVCYIEETRSYLDFNYRGHTVAVNPGDVLQSIAESVARSYRLEWASASEFTYQAGVKRLVHTVVDAKKEESFASLFR